MASIQLRKEPIFLRHSPNHATIEDLQHYEQHQVDQGISTISLNAAIIGVKFFFDLTLAHPRLMSKMLQVTNAPVAVRRRSG